MGDPAVIVLQRRDPAKRMARAYRLALQWALRLSQDGQIDRTLDQRDDTPKPTQNIRGLIPETSAPCDVIREWGRIGSPGKVRADPYPDLATAAEAARALQDAKRRRGYR